VDGDPLEKVFEANIEKVDLRLLGQNCLAEEWDDTNFMGIMFKKLGATELDVSEWMDGNGEGSPLARVASSNLVVTYREATFRMALDPAPMVPKSTMVTQTCHFCVANKGDSPSVTYETSSIQHDVPFGSNFITQQRLEFMPNGSGGATFTLSCRIYFLKSVGFLKGKIISGFKDGAKKGAIKVVDILNEWSPP